MKAGEGGEEEFDDGELVCEGRCCWVGLDTVSRAKVYELLRLCLIRDVTDQNGKMERYTLNEEGRAMLDNPEYVPMIVGALSTGNRSAD